MLALWSIGMATAATVTVDGLIYSISGTTASVTSQGGNKDLIEVVIPETIEVDGTTYEATTVGDNAFKDCSAMTSISIPGSVTSVGNYAFNGCPSLAKLTIASGESSLSLGYSYYGKGTQVSKGRGLFAECPLYDIFIGRNLSYPTTKGTGIDPFYHVTQIKYVTVGKDVTSLCNFQCKLKELIFEKGDKPLSTRSTEAEFIYVGRNLSETGTWELSTLTKIFVSNNVTILPSFYYCKLLENVEFESESQLTEIAESGFLGCSSLKNFQIPKTVIKIGEKAFWYCNAIESITIPASVMNIVSSAFNYCSSLKSVIFEDAETTLEYQHAFSECPIEDLYIGRNINYNVGSKPFMDLTSLTTVVVGDYVTELGIGYFERCNAIQNVYLSKNLTKIGARAFLNSTAIREIRCAAEIPPVVESDAFPTDIYSITTLSVPSSSQRDYEKAAVWKEFMKVDNFNPGSREINGLYYILNKSDLTATVTYHKQNDNNNYRGLTNVAIPETVTDKGLTYTVVGIGAEAFNYCWGLKSITLPETITSIDNTAFGYCTSLRTIEIPNSVKTIGDEAFTGCSALSSAKIGESVESIGDYGFFGCTGLSDITVPESVTHIGEYAFMGVHWLNEVHAESIVPSDAHVTSFSNMAYENATLYVPAGTLDTYKAHPTWSKFLKVKIEGDTSGIDEIESDNETIVTVSGSTITITGKGESDQVTVYDLTGRQLLSTTDSRFTVDQASGIVVVYVNRKAHKVTLR